MDFEVLNLLYRCSKDFSHKKIRMQDLSETECRICSYVYANPACSQDDVSNALRIDKTTVGKALDTLETKACIQRIKDLKDKRKNCLKITQIGYERISDLINIHNEWLIQVMNCLNCQEQKQFEEYCCRLLKRAEQLTDKNGGNGIEK